MYQTTSYGFRDTEHAANLFGLKEFGNIYTSSDESDNGCVRTADCRSGRRGRRIGYSSRPGSYYVLFAEYCRCWRRDRVLRKSVWGTYNLFSTTLPKLGLDVKFVDSSDPENFRAAITEKTKALYAETIGNPKGNVLDIEAVAAIAHEHGIPLIVDNTFPSPYLLRPIEHGADIVVHSATKFIGGHGTSIGGVIVDSGKSTGKQVEIPGLTEPDPSYNGVVYTEAVGPIVYIIKARVQLLRDLGASISI